MYWIGIKVIPGYCFRYYQVQGHRIDELGRFTIHLKSGSILSFPMNKICIKLTKSWFAFEKANTEKAAGQKLDIKPRESNESSFN